MVRCGLAAVVLAGCVTVAPTYTCDPSDPDACVGPQGQVGTCEPSHSCSFPDPTCGSDGARYDSSAPVGRAGVCVVPAIPAVPVVVPAQAVTAGGFVEVEVQSPGNQGVIFDDAGSGTTTAAELLLSTGPCPPSNPIISAAPGSGCPTPFARFGELVNASAYCLVAGGGNVAGEIQLNVYPSIASPPACE